MKMTKSLTCTLAATAIAASAAFAPVANAEVSASVGVANMYLWRGQDLGDGDAAVSGDISVSAAGFYTGIWGSSGDSASGTEYDIYAGWGGDLGPVSVDLSVWTYVYPSLDTTDTMGELSEVILTVGMGPVSVSYYDNIAGSSEYSYATIGAEFGSFGATVGAAFQAEVDTFESGTGNPLLGQSTDYVHLDLSYAYNDNLSFTVSKVIDDDAEDTDDELNSSALFVVSYTLPIE